MTGGPDESVPRPPLPQKACYRLCKHDLALTLVSCVHDDQHEKFYHLPMYLSINLSIYLSKHLHTYANIGLSQGGACCRRAWMEAYALPLCGVRMQLCKSIHQIPTLTPPPPRHRLNRRRPCSDTSRPPRPKTHPRPRAKSDEMRELPLHLFFLRISRMMPSRR